MTMVNDGCSDLHLGTDNPPLYERYPIKYFNRLRPDASYDGLLDRIHAVEFLGEPQYVGGKPVPPQQVFAELAPYQKKKGLEGAIYRAINALVWNHDNQKME